MKSNIKLIPALLWTILVFWLCLLPKNDLPINPLFDFEGFDKIVHFVFYSIMFFLYYFGFEKGHNWLIGFFCIAVGFSIELLQGFLPINRSFDGWDIVANGIGVLCMLLVIKDLES
jgi:hypothetical protein